ncbi:MAG: CHASE2 domain-containing protein [Moraxellaceae bacterium]|nr:CHASE2 domain-containing protein [Moraxellaceae bacterium]
MALLLPPAMWMLQRSPGLAQADLALYDWAINHSRPEPSPDVLIVGIDERSLKTLGPWPWPWPRSVHAKLLEELAQKVPRAVLLDLYLDSESPNPEDDRRLARAMTQVPVYLPLRYVSSADASAGEVPGFQEPLAMFARSAKQVGHATLSTDEDGVARRLFLLEGERGAMRPYVGWQMASELAGSSPPAYDLGSSKMRDSNGWQTQGPFGIPFAGPAGTWRTVPYVSVLRGEVPAELLRGKLILVGALADSKLGDVIPVAGAGPITHLAGIELHANAIDALRGKHTVRFADGIWLAVWTALPLWLALTLILRAARQAWIIALGLGVACLTLCLVVLWHARLWLPPMAPLLGIVLAYFLWSWRRLDALFGFFGERVAALNAVPAGAFEPELRAPAQAWDSVEVQTRALDVAIDRIAQMQALLTAGLWHMPVAVLVCSTDGTITQSNAAARSLLVADSLCGSFVDDPLRGLTMSAVLLQTRREGPAVLGDTEHWSKGLDAERTTARGQIFRAHAAEVVDARGAGTGWVIVLRDLTSERQAEREREQWLRFLSHDMRTPQINILGLLDLHATGAPDADPSLLPDQVRREAERSLALADGFVDLIQARLHTYRFIEVPAGTIALDAVDQVWAHAKACGVTLSTRLEVEDATLWADAALLTRAIVNLLRNAIRHSAAGSSIELCVSADVDTAPRRVRVSVRDQGEGMTSQKMESLLRPTGASSPPTTVDLPASSGNMSRDMPHVAVRSHGIGMAIVRAVVERHSGLLRGVSVPGTGTTFVLDFPLYLPESTTITD